MGIIVVTIINGYRILVTHLRSCDLTCSTFVADAAEALYSLLRLDVDVEAAKSMVSTARKINVEPSRVRNFIRCCEMK